MMQYVYIYRDDLGDVTHVFTSDKPAEGESVSCVNARQRLDCEMDFESVDHVHAGGIRGAIESVDEGGGIKWVDGSGYEGVPVSIIEGWRDCDCPPPPTLEERRSNATLSRMDFMLALDDIGELENVQNATLPKRARIMFDNASQFERIHPELLALADEMGYTDEQLDALFGF